jgi:hypothetical protein
MSKLGTFFSRVEGFFKKVFGSSKWEKTASTTIAIIAPLLETVLTLTAGAPAAALVAAVVATVQKDLAATAVLIDDVDAGGASVATGPQQIANLLNGIKANLGGLLSVAEVKNSAKIAEITTAVTTVTAEVDAILAAIPAK